MEIELVIHAEQFQDFAALIERTPFAQRGSLGIDMIPQAGEKGHVYWVIRIPPTPVSVPIAARVVGTVAIPQEPCALFKMFVQLNLGHTVTPACSCRTRKAALQCIENRVFPRSSDRILCVAWLVLGDLSGHSDTKQVPKILGFL
eukprot:1108884-Rhodomonas_salina.1